MSILLVNAPSQRNSPSPRRGRYRRRRRISLSLLNLLGPNTVQHPNAKLHSDAIAQTLPMSARNFFMISATTVSVPFWTARTMQRSRPHASCSKTNATQLLYYLHADCKRVKGEYRWGLPLSSGCVLGVPCEDFIRLARHHSTQRTCS